MNILQVKDLHKKYDQTSVVKNINLNIKEGEIFGLLGPNGAGKSTTIGMITGLVKITSGEIIFNEKYNKVSAYKASIGLVPQDFALYWDLTAEENVKFFCSLYGYKRQELKDRVNRALEFVGLLDVKKKKASTFSGGMKRRLNLACAIAHSPKLIIMDEPTVGIDPQSRNHILESVKKIREEGATVIYTSHYMEEVEELCDTIAIVDHGKVIAQGTSSELKDLIKYKGICSVELDQEIENTEEVESQIIKTSGINKVECRGNILKCYYDENENIIQELVSNISSINLSIKNINVNKPSLENVFLSLTGKSLRD